MFTFVLMRIIVVVLLVAANAFFAAGEYALVSIRDTRLQQLIDEGRIGARTIRKLHNKLDEVLNGIQIGVTMASLALGWIGESPWHACCKFPWRVCRTPCSSPMRSPPSWPSPPSPTCTSSSARWFPSRSPAENRAGRARRRRSARYLHHHLLARHPHHGRPRRAGCCAPSDGTIFAKSACTLPKSSN